MRCLVLGTEAKCVVSGFTGILTARCEYLNGCVQYCITPPVNDKGEHVDGRYIDEHQLEFVSHGVVKKLVSINTLLNDVEPINDIKEPLNNNSVRTGGDMDNTPSTTYQP